MKFDSANWDKLYKEGNTSWRLKADQLWLDNAGIHSGTAIDLGCGAGEASIWLADHGFEVEGLDFSSEAIAIAKAESTKPTFVQWDLNNLASYEFTHNSYDLIIIRLVLSFVKNQEEFLRIVAGRLNGVCILRTVLQHNTKQATVTPEEELLLLINKFFSIKKEILDTSFKGLVAKDYYLTAKI